MDQRLSRRDWLAGSAGAATIALAPNTDRVPAASLNRRDEPFRFCLNTSTIRGQELTLVEQVEIAAAAGYSGLEPWLSDIQKHVDAGGQLRDVHRRISDLGLTVESAIGFARWIVDDDQQRAAGLETLRRDMDLVRQIGGKRIAAPPAGATDVGGMSLLKIAERYRAALQVGDEIGVVPQLEIWGFSQTLGRLGEAICVAIESAHPSACIMPDVFHLYKGGSDLTGIRLLNGTAMHVFHLNDYPADPPRDRIDDSARVYPGHGVAPLQQLIRDLREIGFSGTLSLELFNREYWQQDPHQVAATGLRQMRELVERALGTN